MRDLTRLRYIDTVAREKSIRKAANVLSITSTALNRRILALEAEIGYPLFERLPSGVRLNTAGELFIDYIRKQISDLERIQSQIADLAGIRRGHVAISCPTAYATFLSQEVYKYRNEHNAVTFKVYTLSNKMAEKKLNDFSIDFAILMGSKTLSIESNKLQSIANLSLPVFCMMAEHHPLSTQKEISLMDLMDYELVMPLFDRGIADAIMAESKKRHIEFNTMIESESTDFTCDYLRLGNALSFNSKVSVDDYPMGIIHRPLSTKEIPPLTTSIVQMKDRVLSVAAAKFVDQMVKQLQNLYPESLIQ